jgi:hypothetical protein
VSGQLHEGNRKKIKSNPEIKVKNTIKMNEGEEV